MKRIKFYVLCFLAGIVWGLTIVLKNRLSILFSRARLFLFNPVVILLLMGLLIAGALFFLIRKK